MGLPTVAEQGYETLEHGDNVIDAFGRKGVVNSLDDTLIVLWFPETEFHAQEWQAAESFQMQALRAEAPYVVLRGAH